MGEEIKKEEGRKKYTLELTENEEFKPIYSGTFKSSIELAKEIKELFSIAFCDVEGARIDLENNVPTVKLFFNHKDHSGDALPCAVERFNAKSTGSRVLDAARQRDNAIQNGDKYYITDDGADIFEEFLLPRYFNRGKVDWKKITAEVADGNAQYGGYGYRYNTQQYTQLSGLDLSRILKKIYGGEKDGKKIEYMAQFAGQINNGAFSGYQGVPSFALMIYSGYEDNIIECCKSLGLDFPSSVFVR